MPPVVSLAAGTYVWCATTRDGAIWCRGNAPATPRSTDAPVPVTGLDGIQPTQLVVGGAHACVLDGDGRVWCWGAAHYGGLGHRPVCEAGPCDTAYQRPALVPGIPKMLRIEAGPSGTCGIALDRSLWCWGYYARTNLFVPEQMAEKVEWVALGLGRVCWLSDGKLDCHMGANDGASDELATLFVSR